MRRNFSFLKGLKVFVLAVQLIDGGERGGLSHLMKKQEDQPIKVIVGKLLEKERNHLANQLRFSDQILELALAITPPRPYLSLHLRGTDRKGDAANPESLLATAHKLANEKGLRDVFVASDDPHLIDMAKSSLDGRGLKNSTNSEPSPRGTPSGTFSAFAEYLALRRGAVFVGGKRSTFSTEIGIT